MLRTHRITPLLYLAPMFLLLGFGFGYPLVAIFNFSTRRIRGATGPFIGLENYRQVFKDNVFREAVSHNGILLLAVPVMVVISILVAVVLYERVKGWRIYRSILFIPYILAVPVVGVVFSNLLQLNGILNESLRHFGLGVAALDWIGSPKMALWSVMGVIIWREIGFGIVLFLARLLSINEELVDASKVDGANWWQRLWYVIIPQLRSVIEFYTVISVITMLAWVFSYIYTISRGGPGTATQIMELYIYNFAFRNQLPGIASAVAVILFLVTLILIIPVIRYRSGSELEEMA
jgi:raffinose/stachyose/melibiose transport system permease protein